MKKEMKNPIADEKKNKWGGSSNHVKRGGSWNNSPGSVRASVRFTYGPVGRSSNIGFRIVRNQK